MNNQKLEELITNYIVDNCSIYELNQILIEQEYYDDVLEDTESIDDVYCMPGLYDILNNIYELKIEDYYYYNGYGHIIFADEYDGTEYLSNSIYFIVSYTLSAPLEEQRDFLEVIEDNTCITRKDLTLLVIKYYRGEF